MVPGNMVHFAMLSVLMLVADDRLDESQFFDLVQCFC